MRNSNGTIFGLHCRLVLLSTIPYLSCAKTVFGSPIYWRTWFQQVSFCSASVNLRIVVGPITKVEFISVWEPSAVSFLLDLTVFLFARLRTRTGMPCSRRVQSKPFLGNLWAHPRHAVWSKVFGRFWNKIPLIRAFSLCVCSSYQRDSVYVKVRGCRWVTCIICLIITSIIAETRRPLRDISSV